MNSPELLLLVENCPKGAETLVTRCLHSLTDKGAPWESCLSSFPPLPRPPLPPAQDLGVKLLGPQVVGPPVVPPHPWSSVSASRTVWLNALEKPRAKDSCSELKLFLPSSPTHPHHLSPLSAPPPPPPQHPCLLLILPAVPPSPELVKRVRDLYHKRLPDVRFLIPVLNGLEKVGVWVPPL